MCAGIRAADRIYNSRNYNGVLNLPISSAAPLSTIVEIITEY